MSDQPEPPGPNPYEQQQPQQPPQQNPYYPQGQPQQPYQQPGQQPGQQQPPYGQPYQQPAYQQPYQQGPYTFTPPPPNHPSATTSMVLGIIGLAGILLCGGVTLVLSPFAWGIGSKAVREIDANPTAYSGRGSAQAGKVMGIIGTVLLIIGILGIIGLIALGVATSDSTTTYNSNA